MDLLVPGWPGLLPHRGAFRVDKVSWGKTRRNQGTPSKFIIFKQAVSCLRILAEQVRYQVLTVKNVKAMSSFSLRVESKESQSTNSL